MEQALHKVLRRRYRRPYLTAPSRLKHQGNYHQITVKQQKEASY